MRGRAESRFQLLSLKGLLSLCKIPPEVLEGKRGNVFGVASASALKVGVRSRSQHSVLSSTAQPGRSEIIKEDTIYEESKDNNEEEERVEANIADLGAGELEEDSEEGQDEEEGEDEGNEDEGDPCNAMRCQGGFDATYQQTLGVDLGDRNTGVAVSWGDVGAPRSLQVLQLPWEELISRLLELAESEGADEIVVGLPLQLGTGNESSNQARKSRTFAERLAIAADARGVRVYLFDEALTSKDAMSYMIKTGVKRKTRKASLDSMAAAVLLETYFRDGGRKAERVSPGC